MVAGGCTPLVLYVVEELITLYICLCVFVFYEKGHSGIPLFCCVQSRRVVYSFVFKKNRNNIVLSAEKTILRERLTMLALCFC